jgi:enterochelin esterase-like enzyme
MRSFLLLFCILPALCAAQSMTVEKLGAALSARRQAEDLAQSVRAWFGKEISTGADAKTDGLNVAWALEAAEAKAVRVKATDGKEFNLKRVGRTPVFALVQKVPEGAAFRWQFEVDGKTIGPERNLEVYSPDPYSIVDPSVPRGVVTQMPKWKSAIYDGTERDWWIYVPAQYKAEEPACLMVFQDGQWAHGYAPPVFDNLIGKHEIPVTVVVFISPGTFADGRSNRSIEYDTLSDKYVRYLLGEIIPEVQKKVNLRTDANSRAIGGISSGGICSFTAAWERPDKFSKVFSWVGSFSNIAGGESGIAGGHNYPALIRRNPPKPIRVFLQDGVNDVDNQFGNWWLCNLSMESAFKFKGYDFKFVGGNGFHSDKHGRSIMGESLKWLWRDVR